MKLVTHFFILFISMLSFSQSKTYDVINLKINNEKPHFALSQYENDKVIFTSYLLTKSGKIKLSAGEPILTIFEAKKNANGELTNFRKLLIDVKEDIKFISSAVFSPDGKHLYVTTNYNSRKNKPKGDYRNTNFHIEMAEYKEGIGWTNFKVLPFCKPKYSYAQPFVSLDGSTLFFVANIRGGKNSTRGGSDLFKVEILENNTYSEPVNLGVQINSYSREMFPFLSASNILYFASNRPNGVGGFDIYKSKMLDDGTFEKAKILPKPINSRKDDISFVIDAFGNGYFTSKRSGGKGDDDVYYFISKN